MQVAGADGVANGGYVLWDSSSQAPELILISTGAEVPTTLAAGQLLAAEGISARVVSMPCVEWFEAQPQGYRDTVLLRGGQGPAGGRAGRHRRLVEMGR